METTPPDYRQLTATATMLQFGHAGEGVETGLEGEVERLRLELQFGHAGEGVETPGHPLRGCLGGRTGFNSATPVKAWRRP